MLSTLLSILSPLTPQRANYKITDQIYTADYFSIQQHCSAGLPYNIQQVVCPHEVINPQSGSRYCCLWTPLFIIINRSPAHIWLIVQYDFPEFIWIHIRVSPGALWGSSSRLHISPRHMHLQCMASTHTTLGYFKDKSLIFKVVITYSHSRRKVRTVL